MQKFLKLMDHRDVVVDGPGMTIAQQGIRAREAFPTLVARSNLHYFRPGDPICPDGTRFLVAVALFSLANLRFLDVVNEALVGRHPRPKRVDVFDFDDLGRWEDLAEYFSGKPIPYTGWRTNPIVGLWEDGVHQKTQVASQGMNLVLPDLGIPATAGQIYENVCPPDQSLFED